VPQNNRPADMTSVIPMSYRRFPQFWRSTLSRHKTAMRNWAW